MIRHPIEANLKLKKAFFYIPLGETFPTKWIPKEQVFFERVNRRWCLNKLWKGGVFAKPIAVQINLSTPPHRLSNCSGSNPIVVRSKIRTLWQMQRTSASLSTGCLTSRYSRWFTYLNTVLNLLPSLKLTLHLKMDDWHTTFLLGRPVFRCFGC